MPDVYGVRPDGYCAHCGANPGCHVPNSYGLFCGACCRWLTYTGPVQAWGEGMGRG